MDSEILNNSKIYPSPTHSDFLISKSSQKNNKKSKILARSRSTSIITPQLPLVPESGKELKISPKDLKSNAYCLFLAFLLAFGASEFGYNFNIFNILSKDIFQGVYQQKEDEMLKNSANMGLVYCFGAGFGSSLVGFFTRKIGKFRSMITFSLISLLAYGLGCIAYLPFLFISRAILGVSAGFNLGLCMPYVHDLVPSLYTTFAAKSLFSFLVGPLQLSLFLHSQIPKQHTQNYWRFFYTFPSLFVVIRIILMILLYRIEAPGDILNWSQDDLDSEETLIKLELSLGRFYRSSQIQGVAKYRIQLYKNIKKRNKQDSSYAAQFKQPNFEKMCVGLFINYVKNASGLLLMNLFSAEILGPIFPSLNSDYLVILIQLMNLSGSLINSLIGNRIETKTMLLIGAAMNCLSFVSLNFWLSLDFKLPAMVSALSFSLFMGMGLGANSYSYVAKTCNATSIGLIMCLKWFTVGIFSKLTLMIIQNLGLQWSLNFFVAVTLVNTLLMQIFLVDTKGRNMDGINLEFQNRWKIPFWRRLIE